MRRVFISYRRGPSTPYARQIYDELSSRLGADRVFYDIDTIQPGTDFVEVIEEHIDESGLMLAVMDSTWATVARPDGDLRLHEEEDPVRMEVSRALARKLKVLPVLVGGAKMAAADELPKDLRPVVRRHAHELSDNRWRTDMEQLVKAVADQLGVEPAAAPSRARGAPGRARAGGISRGVIAAAAAAVLLVGVGAFALLGGGGGGDEGGGSTAALELSSETVSLARQVGSDTGRLADSVASGASTADLQTDFKQSQVRATELADQISSELGSNDPGRTDLHGSATSLGDSASSLAEVAGAPNAAGAAGAAEDAQASMDRSLTGLEQALSDLSQTFAEKGATDAQAAVDSSSQQLTQNRDQLSGVFEQLVSEL